MTKITILTDNDIHAIATGAIIGISISILAIVLSLIALLT